MPVNPDDREWISPEGKRRFHAEWRNSEAGQRFYKEARRDELKETFVRITIWIVIALVLLVVGSAVVKWAVEELAK
jgi:hypothetical protein